MHFQQFSFLSKQKLFFIQWILFIFGSVIINLCWNSSKDFFNIYFKQKSIQYSFYFQSLPLITSKSCDPTLVSQENIPYKNPYSTFFSKMTFWWLMPLLCKGFLTPLELSDLGNLSEKDTSRYHYDQFLFVYHANKVGCCCITNQFFSLCIVMNMV